MNAGTADTGTGLFTASTVLQFYFPLFIFPFMTLSPLFLSKVIWNEFEMGFYQSTF